MQAPELDYISFLNLSAQSMGLKVLITTSKRLGEAKTNVTAQVGHYTATSSGVNEKSAKYRACKEIIIKNYFDLKVETWKTNSDYQALSSFFEPKAHFAQPSNSNSGKIVFKYQGGYLYFKEHATNCSQQAAIAVMTYYEVKEPGKHEFGDFKGLVLESASVVLAAQMIENNN